MEQNSNKHRKDTKAKKKQQTKAKSNTPKQGTTHQIKSNQASNRNQKQQTK